MKGCLVNTIGTMATITLATIAAIVLFVTTIGMGVLVVGSMFTVIFWVVDFLFGTQFFSWTAIGVATLLFICFRALISKANS
ncbi:MAG: hypothetical protein J6F30_17210 [Cellulosilyticum sp.]|nr:hypothetical protein [Cellulosilyticum sp.]